MKIACFLLFPLSISLLPAQGPPPLVPLNPPLARAGNPVTVAKANLGQVLFWDEQLSSTRTVSCGSCHAPASGGSDPRSSNTTIHPGPDGIAENAADIFGSPGVILNNADGTYELEDFFGTMAQVTGRYAPSAINPGYSNTLFWDDRAGQSFTDPVSGQVILPTRAALESQAAGPPLSSGEMAHRDRDWTEVASRIQNSIPLTLSPSIPADLESWINDRNYEGLFSEVFGNSEVTPARIIMAIATYERTLVSNQAPIDALIAGNQNALTPQERQGMQLFGQLRCASCHRGNRFTDDRFHYIGVRPQADDPGRFAVTGNNADRGRMRTPSLRNVALRGEFMHNGRFSSLEEVVDFYNRGGDFDAPNKDNGVRPLNLTQGQENALVAFMGRPLTDPRVASESAVFSRPALFAESSLQPVLGNDVVEDEIGNTPRMVAIEPPLSGSPSFTAGLYGVSGNQNVTLVVDDEAISTGSGIPGADSVMMSFSLTTNSDGSISQPITIFGGGSLGGVSLHGKWFVTGNGTVGESASFETTVFGESVGDLSAPSQVTASDDGGSAEVNLTWNAVPGAVSFEVYRADSELFSEARRLGNSLTEAYSDRDVTGDSSYHYWIVSVNEHEASAPSVPATGSTFDLGG